MVGKFTTSETKTKKKATANYEGGLAYEMDAPNELYSRVGTCLVKEPKFYGKPDEELNAYWTLFLNDHLADGLFPFEIKALEHMSGKS